MNLGVLDQQKPNVLRIFFSFTKTTYLTKYSSLIEHDKLFLHVECALRRSLGSLGQAISLQAGYFDEVMVF